MNKFAAQETLNRVKQRLRLEADPTSPFDSDDGCGSMRIGRAPLVIEGPINQYMFREGQALAMEIVRSVGLKNSAALVARLVAAADGRPGSYAAGIKHVIDAISKYAPVTEGMHPSSSK
ncbi:hypothetical protein QF019_003063 [Pseudomonas frederiksbergensis]|uniref:hypothetical protein n=1 Tax=Pseudomonas frederiksbergensis TaxID=104087 RepID=UPI003D23E89D